MPQKRHVGAGDIEEFQDDHRHAVEMGRPEFPLEPPGHAPDMDVRVEPFGVHVGRFRGENELDPADRFQLRQVGVQNARIFFVIFARGELSRIDEDRDDRHVAETLTLTDQA